MRSSRKPSGSAMTPSGRQRPTARTPPRCSPGWPPARARSSSGSAIFQMPARSPAMTAMTAATIDELSGGRMILGIGSSGPQVAEGWHGQRFGQPAPAHARVRGGRAQGAGRERLEFKGETLELPLPDGPGKALKLMIAPGPGADPDLSGGDRAQEHGAGRRDRRRLDPDLLLARARGRVPGAAPGGRRPRRAHAGRLRHRADRPGLRVRRPRSRPQPDAPGAGAVHRRHGIAQAELLQQPGQALRL